MYNSGKSSEYNVNLWLNVRHDRNYERINEGIQHLSRVDFLKKVIYQDNDRVIRVFKNVKERLAFFLNLFHLIVYFTLCKKEILILPQNFYDWLAFKRNQCLFKLEDKTISALEIEYSILRSSMPYPNFPFDLINFEFPKYSKDKSPMRYRFILNKEIRCLCFGFSLPFVSSPGLRIYSAENSTEELNMNARLYLRNTIEFDQKNHRLVLPSIIRMFHKDFKIQSEDSFDQIHMLL